MRRDFHPGREHLRRVRPLLPLVRPAGLLGPILSPPPVGAPNWRLDGMIILTTVQESGGAEWYHVSYSRPDRVPSHEDTCAVRAAMFRPDALVIAVYPPVDEYINQHPYCLHLWERLGPERLVPDLRVCEAGSGPSI